MKSNSARIRQVFKLTSGDWLLISGNFRAFINGCLREIMLRPAESMAHPERLERPTLRFVDL